MAILLLAAVAGGALSEPAMAYDLGGSAVIYWGDSETLESQSSVRDQRYSLNLRQELTAFLDLTVTYSHFDFDTNPVEGEQAGYRRRIPSVRLRYNRPSLVAGMQWERSLSDGSSLSDNFEIETLRADVLWEPRGDLSLAARFSDTSNVADIGVLGRDTDQTTLGLEARYQRRYWNATYLFRSSDLNSSSNRFSSSQDRHELRFAASRGFLADRLNLGVGGSLSLLDTEQRLGAGADLGEPIPAFQGLFAVNLSPEIGELEPAPALVDGDFSTPVPEGIDIGGANTFRNIGLDLGLIQPVTRIEIAVDRPSGREVSWAVFRSADNLLWEEVPGAMATFDAGILRYTIRFPEVSERYFKAVNLSTNSEPTALVTEVRALRELEIGEGVEDRERTLYILDVSGRYRSREGRLTAQVSAGGRNDESLAAGLVRRDYEQRYLTARLNYRVTEEVEARAGYRFGESDNQAGRDLFRTSESFDVGVRWLPLATVRADLSVQRRQESDQDESLRTTDSVFLNVETALLPDLDLTSRLTYSRLGSVAGGTRTSWTWSELVRSRPLPRWRLDGSFSYSIVESDVDDRVIDRTSLRLSSTWVATAHLNLGGDWYFSRSEGVESVRQRYSLGYNPGPKLSLGMSYERYSNDAGRRTISQSLGGSYALNPRFRLLGDWARSETTLDDETNFKTDSFRYGLSLYF